MKKLLILLVCLVWTLLSHAQHQPTKRALIIAIGDYPKETGWPAISSANDVNLINSVLHRQGFTENNITVVQVSQLRLQR